MTENLEQRHPWNVVTERDFKKRVEEILEMVYDALKKTVGPYGSVTMIEKLGQYHMTKDGFTVIQNIHFNNRTDNAIMDLILTISHQMVMKVGDGSTTAILMAYKFLEEVRKSSILNSIRPKDLMKMMQWTIEELSDIIQSNSKNITDENFVDVMQQIAAIATNDNDTYTKFIREIYEKCGKDVTITKEKSATTKDYYEIKDDMFYINGKYLDKVYLNTENDTCVMENPVVVLFDFTLEDKHWQLVQAINQQLASMDRNSRLLIIAPYYDQYFTDRISGDVRKFRQYYKQQSKQDGAVPYPTVYGAAPFIRGVDHYIFADLAPFLGSAVINQMVAAEMLDKLAKYIHMMQEDALNEKAYQNAVMMAQQQGKDPNDIKPPTPSADSAEIWKDILKDIGNYTGTCERVVMSAKTIEFNGFKNMDKPMVDVHTKDAKAMLDKEFEQVENLRYVGKDYFYAKERLARLACRSANIFVGGNSELEKSMNMDALDDAIKACQSASQYGYCYGNNLSIVKAIDHFINNKFNMIDGSPGTSDELESIVLAIKRAVYDVVTTIYQNKNADKFDLKSVAKIIDECVENDYSFDLNTERFCNYIINPTRTDIEILKGAISIIGMIVMANQYIAGEIQDKK